MPLGFLSGHLSLAGATKKSRELFTGESLI